MILPAEREEHIQGEVLQQTLQEHFAKQILQRWLTDLLTHTLELEGYLEVQVLQLCLIESTVQIRV